MFAHVFLETGGTVDEGRERFVEKEIFSSDSESYLSCPVFVCMREWFQKKVAQVQYFAKITKDFDWTLAIESKA